MTGSLRRMGYIDKRLALSLDFKQAVIENVQHLPNADNQIYQNKYVAIYRQCSLPTNASPYKDIQLLSCP